MSQSEQIKICPGCGLDKPISHFRPRGPGKYANGLTLRCDSCRLASRISKAKSQASIKANIERMRSAYADKLMILRPASDAVGNVRMVDQRYAGAILSVVRQMR